MMMIKCSAVHDVRASKDTFYQKISVQYVLKMHFM